MKKVIVVTLVTVLLLCVISGCGNQTFTCALCNKEVHGTSNEIDVLGFVNLDVCNKCRNRWQMGIEFYQMLIE